MSGGRSGRLGELHEGDDEHYGAERDEPAARTPAREMGADAYEEEDAGEEHRGPDVVVGGSAGRHACGELLARFLVWRLRLIESRLSVLGHVGRAARRGWIRLRVGGPPGLERDRKLGTEATLRNRHRLLIIGHVSVEPGLKGGLVEVPVLPRVKVRPARLRPRSEARVINSADSPFHFAAAKPDQAAAKVTRERRTASAMARRRSRRSGTSWPLLCLACSASSFPTSVPDSPSDMRRAYRRGSSRGRDYRRPRATSRLGHRSRRSRCSRRRRESVVHRGREARNPSRRVIA